MWLTLCSSLRVKRWGSSSILTGMVSSSMKGNANAAAVAMTTHKRDRQVSWTTVNKCILNVRTCEREEKERQVGWKQVGQSVYLCAAPFCTMSSDSTTVFSSKQSKTDEPASSDPEKNPGADLAAGLAGLMFCFVFASLKLQSSCRHVHAAWFSFS